jgi:hypothetical protein
MVKVEQVVEFLLGGVRQCIRLCDQPAQVIERHGWRAHAENCPTIAPYGSTNTTFFRGEPAYLVRQTTHT